MVIVLGSPSVYKDIVMSVLTALDLARIQFAFTVSFHIIFPSCIILRRLR